ncbi:OB-fold nucleic acid binding domain-containing protein [Nonomuraea sp. NPDC001699]
MRCRGRPAPPTTPPALAKAGAFDSLGHHRQALVAVHEQAVDAVVDLKRNEAHGQDSLFGEPGRSSAFSTAIPQGEWDRATLLAFEREMLGLYVSSHPLDGVEHVLDANRDTTIAELQSSGRQDATVRVSGIVSGLQRKITKQGSPWAIVTLEDHDAAVECLIFPKTYTLYGEALAEDQVISVRGRVNVRLHRQGAKGLLLNLRPFQVTLEPALYSEVKALLGPGAIWED